MKETYKRDLQKRPNDDTRFHSAAKMSQETHITQQRPTSHKKKPTEGKYKTNLHPSKETYDTQKKPV